MPDATPAVTVVVPVYDGERTIAACLEALLAQDFAGPVELVVVDNRSTDATRQIVARYPVRLLEERRLQSSYAARNLGVARSLGRILAFTDADCEPAPDWLTRLTRALAADDACGVAGRIEPRRTAASAVERYQAGRALRAERAFAHPVLPFAQTANAAFPREVFERVGGFDPGLVFGGDLDFSWRVQRATGRTLAYAPDALVRHRHRTTYRGLFALYEKNALANCLLAGRYAHYAGYPRLRTAAYLARECACELAASVAAGEGSRDRLAAAVRHAGELSGWLRWHARAAGLPRIQTAGARWETA
jgi:glycosyltransferase involved in cell wall biosynthesis